MGRSWNTKDGILHSDEPIIETVKRMVNLPNDAHPGEQFVYGYNTDILGAVIEIVSGKASLFSSNTNIKSIKNDGYFHFYLPKVKEDRLATVTHQQRTELKEHQTKEQ